MKCEDVKLQHNLKTPITYLSLAHIRMLYKTKPRCQPLASTITKNCTIINDEIMTEIPVLDWREKARFPQQTLFKQSEVLQLASTE